MDQGEEAVGSPSQVGVGGETAISIQGHIPTQMQDPHSRMEDKKSNRASEYDQGILSECMVILQRTPHTVQLICTDKNAGRKEVNVEIKIKILHSRQRGLQGAFLPKSN
jgi:hypothetical protein